jgi:hypothetical protein
MGDAMEFKGVARRISDLEALAAHPAEEAKARRQDPEDGGWGQCHSVWFFKVNATFDHITNPAYAGGRPHYSLRLFDRVNTPQKLTRYFDSLSTSDIAAALRSRWESSIRGQPQHDVSHGDYARRKCRRP